MSKLILSLDGGGIRGAATTQFLTHVEKALQKQHQKSLRDCVDFYAGTSTGSLIALALATTDMDIQDINKLYNVTNAKKIFTENRGFLELDGVNAPKYKADGKTELLKKSLGQAKIKDVPEGKHILAVTYGVEKHRPYVVKSTRSEFQNLLSYQVADASSAAPTYFPTQDMTLPPDNEQAWLIDGGVVANNPTMCAIAEACRLWPDSVRRVLSIGTGSQTRKINGPDSRHWGALQWMLKGCIIDVLSDEKVVGYQAITITPPGNYIRVNAEMRQQPGFEKAPDDAMDDISQTNIKRLKGMGDFWFDQYGEAVVELLNNSYEGPSLDRIDPTSGKPIMYKPD
ncbi:patatin-like phospholipase family protein [Paraglaciecola chathamensis]|uniref:patatin-like phospholipase family protein n=1 Tax=Paraglaciecola chathamensis TaxID=368405 RepID=UPI0026F71E07|nr:patatin-like phospholipase family protein [Paraglaciecola chathamensis]MDO6839442.1 patatin-like phospholipase family protein [Paraglaciecola chathamensis]